MYLPSKPAKKLDRMVDIWNQYQCMITVCFSRSSLRSSKRYRTWNGIPAIPIRIWWVLYRFWTRLAVSSTLIQRNSRRQLLSPISTIDKKETTKSDRVSTTTPMADSWNNRGYQRIRRFHYSGRTGSRSIMKLVRKYFFHHLTVSFDHVTTSGPHMVLPLSGRADWNDCLNLNCFSNDRMKASRLPKINQGRQSGAKFNDCRTVCGLRSRLCGIMWSSGKTDEAVRAQNISMRWWKPLSWMVGMANDWFLRAYDYFGNKVGSKRKNEEGKSLSNRTDGVLWLVSVWKKAW